MEVVLGCGRARFGHSGDREEPMLPAPSPSSWFSWLGEPQPLLDSRRTAPPGVPL